MRSSKGCRRTNFGMFGRTITSIAAWEGTRTLRNVLWGLLLKEKFATFVECLLVNNDEGHRSCGPSFLQIVQEKLPDKIQQPQLLRNSKLGVK